MNAQEIDDFLGQPFIGALAVLRNDGSPAVAPVWYRWHEGTIRVWGDPTTWWIKRLQTEPRVAFSVFEHELPYRAVYIRGTATVRFAGVEELMPELAPITARYVGEERAVATVRSYDNGEGKGLVVVTPSSVRGAVNS